MVEEHTHQNYQKIKRLGIQIRIKNQKRRKEFKSKIETKIREEEKYKTEIKLHSLSSP
jgi:hypothetical protein